MAYESAPVDALLAAAVGEDPALMRDLRLAFLTSAEEQYQALTMAASLPEWHMAALRFKGLCASFGLTEMSELVEQATERPLRDPGLLRRIGAMLQNMSAPG
ncbi:hypothetical protein BH10PSE13_BH10PSE13_23580 [soil metagenome]